MENEVIKTIVSQGTWAVLFVWLLFDTREERLQTIINKNQEVIGDLAEKFDVVENIEADVKEIKIKLDVKEGI